MRQYLTYIFGFLLLIPNMTFGRDYCALQKTDTLKRDTLITVLPLTLKIPKDSISKHDPIFQYINQQRTKNKLSEWIGNLIVNNLDTAKKKDNIDYEKEYKRLRQKTISNIHYVRLDPFGTSINDTTKKATMWIEKTGNNLRLPTAKRIIRKNITISEGMVLDPRDIFESERILRQLDFIGNAKILVKLNDLDTTMVDLQVITRDRFPHAFSIGGNIDSPEMTFYSRNLTGNGVGFAHTSAYENGSRIGNKEHLTVNNFERTRIELNATYSNMIDDQQYSLRADRSFYISQLKYAGGFLFNRSYKNKNHPASPRSDWNTLLDYRYINTWAGRSFKLNTQNYFDQSHIYFIAQYAHSKFYDLPDSLTTHPALADNDFYFGSITFSKRNYYKNNKIYNFDRTEDVPYGFMTTLTYGINNAPKTIRPYLKAHFSFGKALVPNRGYLYGKIEVGSFFNSGKSEQGEIILSGKYISRLYQTGRSQFRNFIELNYVKGINRYSNEYLQLTEKQGGITSIESDELIGKERLVLKTENVFFTPHRFIGFNLMVLSFADLGIIGNGRSGLFSQNYQASLGAAIRFINNKLVFNTIEIRLAWLPLLPDGEMPFDLRISGESNPEFDDFVPGAPKQNTYK